MKVYQTFKNIVLNFFKCQLEPGFITTGHMIKLSYTLLIYNKATFLDLFSANASMTSSKSIFRTNSDSIASRTKADEQLSLIVVNVNVIVD